MRETDWTDIEYFKSPTPALCLGASRLRLSGRHVLGNEAVLDEGVTSGLGLSLASVVYCMSQYEALEHLLRSLQRTAPLH